MELQWSTKLKIGGVIAVGIILVGVVGWPLAAPADPLAPVRAGNLSFFGAVGALLLAFAAGLISYFVSWPYGRQIGVLAAPFGLAVWATRSGSMTTLMQFNPAAAQRRAVLISLNWEPAFWLLLVAAGFAGVLAAQRIRPMVANPQHQKEANRSSGFYLNVVISFVASALVAQFAMAVLARDLPTLRSAEVAQPAIGQIIFALLVSFGLAGFLVKKFLNLGYVWPIVACVLVNIFAIRGYVSKDVLERFVESSPAAFFPNATITVLPVQMVAFGTLGSVIGYWVAVRYDYWRSRENA